MEMLINPGIVWTGVKVSDNINPYRMGNELPEECKMKRSLLGIAVCLGMVFSLFFCLPACKKEAAGPKVETIDGVTYVHNPATPLHPGRTVAFEEDFTFKEKDEAGEIRIYKPGRFIVDSQGNVFVQDNSDMAIKVFDAQGKYLRAVGRKGSGPGEFGQIADMAILPDGRLLFTDFETRRTSLFNRDGQFLSSFQWKKFFSQVYLVTDSSYTVADMVVSERARELWVKTIDFNGEEILTFGKFSYPEFKMLQQGEITFSTSVPWSPQSVFAGDQKRQWLYHCLNDKYVIEVYDSQGKLFRKIDRPYEPAPVTSADTAEFMSRFKDRPDSPFAKMAKEMELPKVKTVTDRMVVDSEGNLWVRTNEEKKEDDKTFTAVDILDPEGFYTARVWLDIFPALFAAGKMYRAFEDEGTGLSQLKRYRVVWKES